MSDIPDHAKKAFSGDIFTVWQWEQELYDGSSATFEAITRPNTAFAIGALPGEKVLMIRDSQPHREAVIGSPGGRADEGETAEETARREFTEETGYEIGELRHWFTQTWDMKIHHANSYFIARDLKKIAEPESSPGEKIELLELTFDEFVALGIDENFREIILRLKLLEVQLDEDKKKELYTLLYG